MELWVDDIVHCGITSIIMPHQGRPVRLRGNSGSERPAALQVYEGQPESSIGL